MKNSTALLKIVHLRNNLRFVGTQPCRYCSTSTKADFKKHQNELFNAEQKRQREEVGRIEKIAVTYRGTPKDVRLIMNKNISTPFNCAQHMLQMLIRRSALAVVDGSTLWDMHRPLESDCELQLLHFQDENPSQLNKTFWRTCSLMLGAVAETAFKDNVEVKLHSFPKPNVRSGSFVYDVEMPNLSSWNPTTDELRILSAEMVKLSNKNLAVERLEVKEKLSLQIFENNKHKLDQIPDISARSPDKKVTLYRIGDHIDISRGPMVGNTWFLGRCTISAVHKLESDRGNFYRFQGVALPKGLMLNHYAFSILEKRAMKLNKGLLPWQYETDSFHPELQSVGITA
ncbi:large ribosomal subunit protein mL39 [Planococcus citri]|uniref:large ribosomal subunit protein mL39 n=1 Tax=Planococcus citri TaxID=170843 RepID=UPI0031F8011A